MNPKPSSQNTPKKPGPASAPQSIAERSSILRFLRWLMKPRTLGYLAFALALLITLLTLFYLTENWRGSRAWKQHEARLTQAGVSTDMSDYLPDPVADEQNFALHPFLKPLFDFKPGTQEWRDKAAYARLDNYAKELQRTDILGDWSLAKAPDVEGWFNELQSEEPPAGTHPAAADAKTALRAALSPYETDLDTLAAYFEGRRCRFPVAYDSEPVFGILLPHLKVVRTLATLSSLRAHLHLMENDSAMATRDLLFSLRLGDALGDEPFLIAHLVHGVIVRQVQTVLWTGMRQHRWSVADLRTLQSQFDHTRFLPRIHHALLAEHAGGLRAIDEARRNPALCLATLQGGDVSDLPFGFQLIWRFVPDGWFEMEKTEYSRLFLPRLEALQADKPDRLHPRELAQAYKDLEREFDQSSEWSRIWQHRVLASLLMPALQRLLLRTAFADVSTRFAVVACALEQHYLTHGSYPDDLSTLTPESLTELPQDPLTGDDFHYQPLADGGYTLYSVGWNLTDENGESQLTENGKNLQLDAGDWVWRCAP